MESPGTSFFVNGTSYHIDSLVDLARGVRADLTSGVASPKYGRELGELLDQSDRFSKLNTFGDDEQLQSFKIAERLLDHLSSDSNVWKRVARPILKTRFNETYGKTFADVGVSIPPVIGLVRRTQPVVAINADTGARIHTFTPLYAEVSKAVLGFDAGEAEAGTNGASGFPEAIGYGAGAPVVVRSGGDSGGGGGSGSGSTGPNADGGVTHSDERYLVADLPARAPVGKDVSLLVHVAVQPVDGLPSAGFPLAGGTTITVVVSSPGLTATLLQQDLDVPRAGDSKPIRFAFETREVGLQVITISAFLGGSFLGQLSLQISVEREVRPEPGAPRTVPIRLTSDPGEVSLQVLYDSRENQYTFQLLSSEYPFAPVTQALAGTPTGSVERTARILSDFAAKRSGFGPENTRAWLYQSGVDLWSRLVPDTIKEQYWTLRDDITSFSIFCEEDMVPWELLHPVRKENQHDGFLVEQFPVTRRVLGQRRVRVLQLGDAHFVVPGGSPTDAEAEVAAVWRRLGGTVDAPEIEKLSDLNALLAAADFGLLHFACHNSFDAAAGGSSIKMRDGRFEPTYLSAARELKLFQPRTPLVFFNACRSAGEVVEYTELNGWASAFTAAGAGAFVGTLWSVRSSSAVKFADTFYRSLIEDHKTLGEAATVSREEIKTDDDPTWLAYTVYGDAGATVGTT